MVSEETPLHDGAVAEKVVVIGASAGGIAPLMKIVAALPADFPAAVCIVQHLPATRPSLLPAILAHGSMATVHPAMDGQPLLSGNIYVAPPDRHLFLAQGRIHLSQGPHQDHWRPSVDALFRSAAHCYGARTIGVVLSGSMHDGAAGLAAIADRGGATIVQDPAEAQFASMPRRALQAVREARVAPVAEIGPLLVQLAADPDAAGVRASLRRRYRGYAGLRYPTKEHRGGAARHFVTPLRQPRLDCAGLTCASG